MLYKKDFEAIAQTVSDATTDRTILDKDRLVIDLTKYFINQNPKFSPDKFIDKCYQ